MRVGGEEKKKKKGKERKRERKRERPSAINERSLYKIDR